MNVENETVFVIYRNGKPYEHVKKPVYLRKNHATGQITSIAKDEAERIVRDDKNRPFGVEWYQQYEKINELTEKIKAEFEVVEYWPNPKFLARMIAKGSRMRGVK